MSELKDQVLDNAELAVSQLQERAGSNLDYSRHSLAAIDSLLAEASGFVEEMPDDKVHALVKLAGSYILAVAAKEFDGEFYWYDEEEVPVYVVGEPDKSIAIIPFDKIRGRLYGDKDENIPYFYEGFADHAVKAETGEQVTYM